MSVGRVIGYQAVDGSRVLRGVLLCSPVDRAVDPRDNFRVRVSVGRGATLDSIGEWDGASLALKALTPLPIGAVTLAKALPFGGVVVVETERRGLPSSLIGSSVQLRIGHAFQRAGQALPDREVRDALEAMDDLASQARFGEVVVPVPLGMEPVGHDAQQKQATTQTVSSTSYVDSLVAITFKMPSWARSGWVQATGHATFSGAGAAASTLYVKIGDGTTDHNEEAENTDGGAYRCPSTSVGFQVFKTTTLTLRFKKDAVGANADVILQTLAGSAEWRA